MVELVVLQLLSYMAGALGVFVAAIYYVMTLRVQQTKMKESINNHRATFSSNQSQYACSEEWVRAGELNNWCKMV
jgi:flagellar biogenesis protein FliO